MRRPALGFSLVEVLVSMAILTISVVGTLPLISMALQRSIDARRVTTAQHLAASIMDQLRFDVRHDPFAPTDKGCGGGNSGCSNGQAFTLANAWRSESLPHSTEDTLVELGAPGCAAGGNDGVTYRVGPFPVRFGGNQYMVCYRLQPSTLVAGGAAPAGSVDARVKVIWSSPGGYGSRALTSTLIPGVP